MKEDRETFVPSSHKPKANHPWRNFVRTDVHKWAYEQSRIGKTTLWKKGGGKPQK